MTLDPDGNGWILGAWQFGDVMLRWTGKDWVRYLGDFPDGEVLALASAGPGDFWAAGWALGRSRAGMVWRWGLNGWTRVIRQDPIPVMAAAFLAPDDAWAAGEDGLLAHWDGAGWEYADSPTNQTLSAIAFLAPNDGWAAGEGGQILHWDGAAWTVKREYRWRMMEKWGEYPRIESLAFMAPDDGWAAGRYEGAEMLSPLLLHWDGSEWTEIDLGGSDALCKCALSALYFRAPNDGWALGGGEKALMMHWDGKEWTAYYGPEFIRLAAAGGLPDGGIWTAGLESDDFSTLSRVIAMHWDGAVWKTDAIPAETSWLRAILMNTATDGWMAGKGIFHWTGAAWEEVTSPVDSMIMALARTSDGALWGVTDTGSVIQLSILR